MTRTMAEVEAEIAAKYHAAIPEFCRLRAKDIVEKYVAYPGVMAAMAALTEDIALAIFLANMASHTAVWQRDLLKEVVAQLRLSESTYARTLVDKIKRQFWFDED